MTTLTSEIDARHAAQLAERLRAITMESRPALADDQLDVLDEAAGFLDDAAGVERGERVMESSMTGETYVVHKWIDLGDAGVIALAKEPAEDEEESA
jgi:hypothetical protein